MGSKGYFKHTSLKSNLLILPPKYAFLAVLISYTQLYVALQREIVQQKKKTTHFVWKAT